MTAQVFAPFPIRSTATRALVGLALCSAVLLSGCASSGAHAGKPSAAARQSDEAKKNATQKNAEITSLISSDPVAAASYWGSIYDSDPKNADAAAAYGDALRKIGSLDKAQSVLRQACDANPQHAGVLAAYGKALIVADRPVEAAPILQRAASLAPKDAATRSAAAVALDQAGDHEAAKVQYEAALALEPKNPAILNNFAVSQLLAGKPADAEVLLRKAIALPGATAQVRQNLALALGLEGRYEEAQRLASNDLMPKAAQNNMDYIRDLMGQPARWNDRSGLDSAPAAAGKPAAETPKAP